jgi:hypothetical protein
MLTRDRSQTYPSDLDLLDAIFRHHSLRRAQLRQEGCAPSFWQETEQPLHLLVRDLDALSTFQQARNWMHISQIFISSSLCNLASIPWLWLSRTFRTMQHKILVVPRNKPRPGLAACTQPFSANNL